MIAMTPNIIPPSDKRTALNQPFYSIHILGPVHLRCMAYSKKYRGFCQTMDKHMKEATKGCKGSSEAKGKGRYPHMLNGRIRKHALDVLLPE